MENRAGKGRYNVDRCSLIKRSNSIDKRRESLGEQAGLDIVKAVVIRDSDGQRD